MSSELGKIERPEAEQFRPLRKVYLVPLIFAPRQTPPDYADLYERFWTGVREHLLKLEHSIGPIARVYHDSVGVAGEEGLAMAERINDRSGAVARSKVEAGAAFEALEDPEMVAENLDWQRCLLVGLESRKATELIWGNYSETIQKRYELIAQRLQESLQPEEAGLLFISEDHRVQFPSDIRVFYVAPPALDEIHRWLRDQQRAGRQQEGPSAEQPQQG